MTRLCRIEIDDAGLPAPSPEIAQERQVAIFDLLEDNSFVLPGREGLAAPAGPFALLLAMRDGRLVFDTTDEAGARLAEFHLAMGPFRQVVKDYHQICASYFDAVKHLQPAQIEAIDMARRGIHNRATELLMERLEGKIETDFATARRLFTLICVLHIRG